MKEVAGVAENQLLHRLFFTSSPCFVTFCKSSIISNNVPRTCVQRVSETFAVKVVPNAIAGMVQRREQQSPALRRKAVSAWNCKGYKKKIARNFTVKSLAINKFWWSDTNWQRTLLSKIFYAQTIKKFVFAIFYLIERHNTAKKVL